MDQKLMSNPSLWIFGDSFSVPGKVEDSDDLIAWQWGLNLANKLHMVANFIAEYGVSNEWIILQLNSYLKEFKPGDKIIVQTTQANRFPFLDDTPSLSNMQGVEQSSIKGLLTKEQYKAISLYYKHIQTDEKDQLRHEANISFLNTMKWLLSQNNIELVIIPGFAHPKVVPLPGPQIIGTLQTISKNEFITNKAGEKWYARGYPDTRLNHICKDNHEILADRLYEYLKNKRTLDLATGYRSTFLSVDLEDQNQLAPNVLAVTMNPIFKE